MLRNRSTHLAGVALVLVVLGCRSCETIDSSKLDPSEIYQEYSISASTKTEVRAEFRVSGSTGTTVALVSPSVVEHNGRSMDENLRTVLSGTFYSDETEGFVGTHTFVFTDSAGKKFTNTVIFEPIEIGTQSVEINRTARTFVVPLSRGLASGESLNVQIASEVEPPKTSSNSNSNSSAPDLLADVSGRVDNESKTLTVDTESLKNFAVGKAAMRVTVLGTRPPTEIGIRGGTISYRIESSPITAKIY